MASGAARRPRAVAVNVPWGAADAQQIVFHAATGACSRWTGIPASVWLETSSGDFAGHAGEGTVLIWGDDTSDNGGAISAELLQAFPRSASRCRLKAFKLVMPVMADAETAAVESVWSWTGCCPTPPRSPAAPARRR
jgi:hypothetical protein